MIRVLQIIGSLERGGAETFLINLYRNIDKTKIQFDFVIYSEPSENSYYQEVKELGGKVFITTPKSEGILKNFKTIKTIVKENNYDIVWKHTESCFRALDLLAAKCGGATRMILHSHSSYAHGIEKLLHYMFRLFIDFFVTDRLACGDMTGHWMFGRQPFQMINNGIKIDDFTYDRELREQYRLEFRFQNKIVIGHVGRFHPVKNHRWIINVFEKFKEENSDAILVLVGAGELMTQMQELTKAKGLEEDVCFVGSRSDIPQLLQMMDIFIMPSIYEGFPVTLIEAQAAGLPCVVSSTISKEVDVTGNMSYVDLDAPVEVWVDQIVQKCGTKKEDNVEYLKAAGYDIKDVAKKIERNILEMAEKGR